jgi:hypothetical protein
VKEFSETGADYRGLIGMAAALFDKQQLGFD